MYKLFFTIFLFTVSNFFSQNVSGNVLNENQVALTDVLVINLRSNQKTFTDHNGRFTITATTGDELRWVRAGFERVARKVSPDDYFTPMKIQLSKSIIEIAPLTISSNRQKIENLKNEIGLPRARENAREKVPELKRDVLLPLLAAGVNIDAIYKIASGDARRMKRSYAYDDLQYATLRIRAALTDEYFLKAGIPEERINEFIQFALGSKPQISAALRLNNLTKIHLLMEEMLPVYVSRLHNSAK